MDRTVVERGGEGQGNAVGCNDGGTTLKKKGTHHSIPGDFNGVTGLEGKGKHLQ